MFARNITEWLRSLWGINARQADFVLNPVNVEDFDGIAIGDGHHLATNVRSGVRDGEYNENNGQGAMQTDLT